MVALIAYSFAYFLSRHKNMNAEIPDAQMIKNRTISPKEGIPNISASKIIKQKAMRPIFLNLNDFSLDTVMDIN
jgi:hypothetical protein